MVRTLASVACLVVLAACGDDGGERTEADAAPLEPAYMARLKQIADDYPSFTQDPEQAGATFDRALGGDAFALIDITDPASLIETINVAFVPPDADATAANVHEIVIAHELFKMSLVPLVDEAAHVLPEIDDEVLVAAGFSATQFASDLDRLTGLASQASAELTAHLASLPAGPAPYGDPGGTVPPFDAAAATEAALLAHELIHPIQQSSGVEVRGWDPETKEQIVGIPTAPTTDSVADDLQKVVVLCNKMADDPSGTPAADVAELQATLKNLAGPKPYEAASQTMQTISNVSKAKHDTAVGVIRKI